MKLKILIAVLFFTSTVEAQQMLSVEEAVAVAMENNYEIRLLKNDSSVFALYNNYAYAAFLPRLNASSAILFNNINQKQKLADNTERKRNGIKSNNENASINLNWTLFNGFGMSITRKKLGEMVKLGEINIRNQLLITVSDVIIHYYNIVSQKQQLRAIEELMTLNEERVSQSEKRLSVGLGAKPELLQSKLDLNAQRAAKLTQLNLISQLKERLNQLMVVAPGTNYEVADSIPIHLNLMVNDTYQYAEKNNPALQIAKQNISIAHLTLKERKAERWPVVNFNSAYNFSQTNNQAVVNNFTPLFNRNLGFNYGFSATIPIFNGFTVKRQIQEAELGIAYQQLLYDYEKSRTMANINIAFKNYEMQKQHLALEEENIILARENVFIASERFRLGITTVLDLRETQKSLEDALSRLIAARYNTKVAETDLLRLRGDLIK